MPNRNSPPAVLLRESFRQDGKVKKRTLANLSKWPDDLVDGLRILLRGGVALPSLGDAFAILRSRPHGPVAAVLGTARRLGLEKLLDRRASRERALAAAMILARILDPRSKLATARTLRRYKVGKHFDTESTDDGFSWTRNVGRIAEEAALDGIYVIRTNVPAEDLSAEEAVRSYKGLSRIERAFRSYKTVDLKVRPVHHRLEGRVRAHIFLCMLACYVEWHMRRALAPLLFDDDDPVAPACPSPSARAKAGRKRTPGGLPVHSFHTLLADLATLTRNRVQPAAEGAVAADVLTSPTPLQAEVFRLLGVRP